MTGLRAKLQLIKETEMDTENTFSNAMPRINEPAPAFDAIAA
jgi:hypothetical protein